MDRFMGHQMKQSKPYTMSDITDSEISMMRSSKRKGEKIYIQLVIDYICKDKSWEDLKTVFRPRGSMTKWTADTAKLLGLKSTTNYDLNYTPPSSPLSSPTSKDVIGKIRKKKRRKSKKKSLTKKKLNNKQKSKSKKKRMKKTRRK